MVKFCIGFGLAAILFFLTVKRSSDIRDFVEESENEELWEGDYWGEFD